MWLSLSLCVCVCTKHLVHKKHSAHQHLVHNKHSAQQCFFKRRTSDALHNEQAPPSAQQATHKRRTAQLACVFVHTHTHTHKHTHTHTHTHSDAQATHCTTSRLPHLYNKSTQGSAAPFSVCNEHCTASSRLFM